MRSLFGSLVVLCVVILWAAYAWNHMRHATLVAPAVPPKTTAAQEPPSASPYDPARDAHIKLVGPLAAYVENQQGAGSVQGLEAKAHVETLQAAPVKPHPADLVGNSVVGTTMPVLQSTFRVRAAVQVPFEVPPHAATPRLKGSYQSFLKQAGPTTDEGDANVELLLLNEQQYAAFLEKRAGEAVFAAEEAHQQEVNANLPPTLSQPQKYHLVFRNNSKAPARKFVQADFHMEF